MLQLKETPLVNHPGAKPRNPEMTFDGGETQRQEVNPPQGNSRDFTQHGLHKPAESTKPALFSRRDDHESLCDGENTHTSMMSSVQNHNYCSSMQTLQMEETEVTRGVLCGCMAVTRVFYVFVMMLLGFRIHAERCYVVAIRLLGSSVVASTFWGVLGGYYGVLLCGS